MNEKLKQIMDNMYGKKVFFFLPLAIVILFLLIFVLSFFNSSRNIKLALDSVVMPSSYEMDREESYSQTNKGLSSPGSAPAPTVANIERKIVKDGFLDVLVKKVEDTSLGIQEVATRNGGQVDNINISDKSTDTKYGTITIRVPNDKFGSAIEEIKKLAVKVNSERVSSVDVTLQYVDLEARLKSKKAVESQYVALLDRASKVEEIVTVHSYLDRVREEIEMLEAQMNYLANQVSMSSISVSMTSETEVQIFGITWRPLTVIKQSFRNLLEDLTGTVNWLIGFAFALPVILINLGIFIVILWLVVKIIKKLYRRFVNN